MKLFCALALLPALLPTCLAQTSPSPASPSKVSCKAVTQPLSPAQIEFEQNEYKAAADHFVTELAAHPDDARLRNWQIRNLIAKGDVADAVAKATAWSTEKPNLGLALTTKAEALIRQGQLVDAYTLAAQAQKLDPCNGRTYYVLSEYEDMIALYATEKKHVDIAHVLDPQDAEITTAWIATRPRLQARKEWAEFVDKSESFTDKQRSAAKKRLAKLQEKPPTEECRMTSSVQETTVPFSAIRYSPDSPPAYGLEMSFNGKKRRLELDTGASGLTLTANAAERLGLITEDSAVIGGMGDEGYRKSRVSHVASLKIGNMEFSNCAVYILPPRNMESASYGYPTFMDDIDGLVGGDIFRKFLLTLDYPAGDLKISPLPARPGEQITGAANLNTSGGDGAHATDGTEEALQDRYRSPEMKDWTQFYRIYHFLLIPTQLNDGPVKLLMADTGAEMNVIDPEAARTVTRVSTTNRVSLQGISGSTKNTYLTDKIVLHFAQLYLPLPWMVATETKSQSDGAGVEISGFLGFPALRQMTLQIDYRDSLIHFSFDPKRPTNPKFRADAFTTY